jgi:hypothetical protein
MTEVTKDEFNGLGKRVNIVEVGMGIIGEKAERNEDDIQKIFDSMARLPFIIIATVSVPTVLMVYQVFMK